MCAIDQVLGIGSPVAKTSACIALYYRRCATNAAATAYV